MKILNLAEQREAIEYLLSCQKISRRRNRISFMCHDLILFCEQKYNTSNFIFPKFDEFIKAGHKELGDPEEAEAWFYENKTNLLQHEMTDFKIKKLQEFLKTI